MPDTTPLWRYIHDIVSKRVPPEQREAVTDLVAQTTVYILTTPEFLHGLKIVQDLQYENETLRRAVISLQTQQAASRARPRKVPARKKAAKAAPRKAPAKKAAPRKNAAAKKVPAAQKRAFKKGARGR